MPFREIDIPSLGRRLSSVMGSAVVGGASYASGGACGVPSARVLTVAWVPNRLSLVIGIVSLPSLLTAQGVEYEHASLTVLPVQDWE